MLVSTAPIEQGTSAAGLVPAAASTAVAALLRGPARRGEVVAATGNLLAVQTDDGTSPALICLAGPDAVRLPCAMVLTAPVPSVSAGTPATVGDGRLRLPTGSVVAARWWTPRRPAIADPSLCAARAAGSSCPDLGARLADAAGRLADALRYGRPDIDDAVLGLLGLGPGLTPAGDDVIAGALVALRAVGSPMADRLAAAVDRARPFDRTTAVSAGLLACAARGLSVPQLAALLTALGAPAGDVGEARDQLLGVGHTSGAALYLGALHGLAAGSPLVLGTDRSRTT